MHCNTLNEKHFHSEQFRTYLHHIILYFSGILTERPGLIIYGEDVVVVVVGVPDVDVSLSRLSRAL